MHEKFVYILEKKKKSEMKGHSFKLNRIKKKNIDIKSHIHFYYAYNKQFWRK